MKRQKCCVLRTKLLSSTRAPLFFFLCLIFLNLQTYLCLCVVSGHAPSQRALQEWPVLGVPPSVAAVVLLAMFDKRLKFQKNGLQSCWKPGSPSKGRRKPTAEACISSNVKSKAHSFSLSLSLSACITLFSIEFSAFSLSFSSLVLARLVVTPLASRQYE